MYRRSIYEHHYAAQADAQAQALDQQDVAQFWSKAQAPDLKYEDQDLDKSLDLDQHLVRA